MSGRRKLYRRLLGVGLLQKRVSCGQETLEAFDFVSFRVTNNGTIATLLGPKTFDINVDLGVTDRAEGHSRGTQRALKGASIPLADYVGAVKSGDGDGWAAFQRFFLYSVVTPDNAYCGNLKNISELKCRVLRQ
jgi:hypothetical protein